MGSHLWEQTDGDTHLHPIAELHGSHSETILQLHPWCQLEECAHIKELLFLFTYYHWWRLHIYWQHWGVWSSFGNRHAKKDLQSISAAEAMHAVYRELQRVKFKEETEAKRDYKRLCCSEGVFISSVVLLLSYMQTHKKAIK